MINTFLDEIIRKQNFGWVESKNLH